MKKIALFFILIFSFTSAFSQLEAANWFFGDGAGLDFNPLPVTPQAGQLYTIEGCSSISDCMGNLLMYTDGITIFDRNHNVMPNGNGLMGDPSSSQSGLIVPHPGNPDLFFVFSVDDDSGDNGLRYSVVDMTLNGGNGDVVAGQKNVLLIDKVREKVTAVASLSGDYVWVVTVGTAPQNGNTTFPITTYNAPRRTFYAIKIDASGIAPNAVVTTLPTSFNINLAHGYMKLSTQGDKVAIANYYDQTLYLLDFDINTGVVSNLAILTMPPGFGPYGVEFSPDGNYLYVKGTDGASTSNATTRILQYDLSSPPYNYQQVASYNGYRGGLQLGIDGKIYVAESQSYGTGRNYVGTINNPNLATPACNFVQNSITLPAGQISRQGLPQFIQSFFVQIETEDAQTGNPDIDFCLGETVKLTVSTNKDIDHVDWDFGDGNNTTTPPNASNTKESSVQHTYATDGTYDVTATIYISGCGTIQVITQVIIYPLPVVTGVSDMEFCDDNQNGLVTFNVTDKNQEINNLQTSPGNFDIHYYETLTDAQSNTNEITDPYTTTTPYNQTIWFSVTNNETGCTDYGSFDVIVHHLPEIYTVSDLEECDDNDDGIAVFDLDSKIPEILNGRNPSDYTITFHATQADAENNVNPLSSPYTNTTPHTQTVYYRIVDNNTGCVNVGELNLVVLPKPEIQMYETYYFCTGFDVYVEAPAGFVSYQWSTGETTQGISISTVGQYTVTVTDSNGCTNSKTVTVEESGPPTIEKITTVDFEVNNNGFTVYVSGLGDYEYSIDNINFQDEPEFSGLKAGTYTVYVRDKRGCGDESEEVYLMDAPPYFTPNGDGIHDLWHVINVVNRPGTEVFIYDRYGRLIKTLQYDEDGWNGLFNGSPLPSDDYWFLVKVPPGSDKKIVRGHFTLKR